MVQTVSAIYPISPLTLLTLPNVWVTRDGREIPIKDLADDHIDSILAFLVQRAPDIVDAAKVVELVRMPGPQGEHAQDAYEGEVTRALDRTFTAYAAMFAGAYLAVKREKEKRARRRKGPG